MDGPVRTRPHLSAPSAPVRGPSTRPWPVRSFSHLAHMCNMCMYLLPFSQCRHCQMCCDCVWYCEGIHLIIYTGNRWQPGDPAGNLATSWQPRLPVRTRGDWQPLLATAGNRWQPLATWQPGNLATWQPAGNLLATSAGNLATRGSSVSVPDCTRLALAP